MEKYTVLIMTYIDKKTNLVLKPHHDFLIKSNPEVDIFYIICKDSGNGREYDWRNSDQQLRKWYMANANLIKTNLIAILEWDTLVNKQLPKLPKEYDLVGAELLHENIEARGKWEIKKRLSRGWKEDNWMWWPEVSLLDLKDNESGAGLVSFGCYLMKKSVLDLVCGERWDAIYKKNIISELRFPTVAKVEGVRLGQIDLPFVKYHSVKFTGEKEIYHGVKEKII